MSLSDIILVRPDFIGQPSGRRLHTTWHRSRRRFRRFLEEPGWGGLRQEMRQLAGRDWL